MKKYLLLYHSMNNHVNYIKSIAVLFMLHVYLDNYHIRAKITHMLSKINTYIFYTFKVWNLRQCQISIEPTIFWCWINKSSLQLYSFDWWWQLWFAYHMTFHYSIVLKLNPVFCFIKCWIRKLCWFFSEFSRNM